uniref:Uncharacterized protein n=1 Tax=Helianthus annuus TaxID=4232 RepID=A0A251RTV7_HELAN
MIRGSIAFIYRFLVFGFWVLVLGFWFWGRNPLSFCFLSDVGQKNEGCKPYRASSRAEPGQARARLVYKPSRAELARLQPSQFRAELSSSFFRASCEPRVF